MAWTIKYSNRALKQLGKLDEVVARRIDDYLRQRVIAQGNPCSLGEALVGTELGNFWRYRVGDWRVIAKIEDENVQVFVVKVAHRKDIYENHG